MLDLKFMRDNPDVVRKALENCQTTAPLDAILQIDEQRGRKILELEGLTQSYFTDPGKGWRTLKSR